MKKIGITTITNYRSATNTYNYGNILQNYALQQFLKDKGYEVKTIYYSSSVPEYTMKKFANTKPQRGVLQFFDDAYRVLNRKFKKEILTANRKRRDDKFSDFVKNYISQTTQTYDYNSDLIEVSTMFDYFITGSDQVWNPYYEGFNEIYYLGFVPVGKRISYAPSLGVDHIPEEIIDSYKNWLPQLDYLSIREETGKQVLMREFGIEPQVVCDPVFLLSKEQWNQLACNPKKEQRYFVVYILGKKTVETKRYIKQLENKFGIPAVDVYTRDNPNSFFAGPEEFIGLISGAQFICTDSFHGTAFALIYEKPMVIVDRNADSKKSDYKMNSRINDLLQLVYAGNRSVEYLLQHVDEMFIKFDYHDLEELILDSKTFLVNALNEER